MKIHLRADERVVFVGATGSGKTELAKHFLKRLNRVVIIDPKHTFRLDGFTRRKTIPLLGKRFKIIYRPDRHDDGKLADFLDDLLRLKHVTIYVDELQSLVLRFPEATEVLTDIVRVGRERFVSVWSAMQRPKRVPIFFLSEAEATFMFNLRRQEDRQYMAEYVGDWAGDEIEEFTFWWSHVREKLPALMTLNLNKNYILKIG